MTKNIKRHLDTQWSNVEERQLQTGCQLKIRNCWLLLVECSRDIDILRVMANSWTYTHFAPQHRRKFVIGQKAAFSFLLFLTNHKLRTIRHVMHLDIFLNQIISQISLLVPTKF